MNSNFFALYKSGNRSIFILSRYEIGSIFGLTKSATPNIIMDLTRFGCCCRIPNLSIQSLYSGYKQPFFQPQILLDQFGNSIVMDMGIRVGKKRVARLMREMSICGVSLRKSTQTTRKAQRLPIW